MKIAIDCRFIGKSGIGTYIENIVDSLLKFHPEHHYLMICNRDVIEKRGNVEVFLTDITPFSLKELLCFPVSVINKCDAYFCPYFNLPLGIKIPVYTTIHDVIFLDRRELTSPIGYLLRRLYLWHAMKASKKIFTVSEFSKSRILHHFHSQKEIVVVYNSVSSEIKEWIGCNNVPAEKKNYVLYVGNIKQHKGLKVLLTAYQMALGEGYENELYIVGEAGNFRTTDKEVVEMLSNNNKIKFTGYVPNQELYRLMAEAKLLVLPSFYEGFGLTPLEALYFGTDTLISDIPVLKEIYEDFPVTFFKVGDTDSLKNSLLNHKSKNIDVDLMRKQIDAKYSIQNIIAQILAEI